MKPIKKVREWNRRAYCIALLRRGFMRSRLHYEFLVKHRKKKPLGRNGKMVFALPCKSCGVWRKQSGRKKAEIIYCDHVAPVTPVNKQLISLDLFAERLYCDVKNLQPMCKGCHDAKTKRERKQRLKSKAGKRRE